jgi:hypothetical protein
MSEISSKTIVLVILLSFLGGCGNHIKDERLTILENEFINHYYRYHSVTATLLNYHRFDDQLDDYSRPVVDNQIKELKHFLQTLDSLDTLSYTAQDVIDYKLLKWQIKKQFWEMENYRQWEWDFGFYTTILKNAIISYAVQPDKSCELLQKRLLLVPRFIKTAKLNVKNPNRLSIEETFKELTSLNYLFTIEMTNIAATCSTGSDSLINTSRAVLDSLLDFKEFLSTSIPATNEPESPIGTDFLIQILAHRYQINLPLTSLLDQLKAELNSCFQEMVITAKTYMNQNNRQPTNLSESQIIETALSKINSDYGQDNEIINNINKYLNNIEQFIQIKEIIKLPDKLQLEILRAPIWLDDNQMTHLFYIENGKKYLYYVKDLPSDLNSEEQIAFLKKLNQTQLQLYIINDIIPGKLYIHSNFYNHPSQLRKLFPDKMLIDGWSFLADVLMVEKGYDGYNPKLKLIQQINYYQAALAAIIDLRYHTNQITTAEALDYLIKEGFFESKTAQQMLNTIILNPGDQIAPIWSYLQIKKLYQYYRSVQGNYFSLENFIQRLVKDGPIPISILSNQMKQEVVNKINYRN